MDYNMMDDDAAAPSGAQSDGQPDKDKSDETEDKQALIPSHLFPEPPKPGEEYIFKVVQVYENEVAIVYSYGDDKDKDKDKDRDTDGGGGLPITDSAPQEDEMMV